MPKEPYNFCKECNKFVREASGDRFCTHPANEKRRSDFFVASLNDITDDVWEEFPKHCPKEVVK